MFPGHMCGETRNDIFHTCDNARCIRGRRRTCSYESTYNNGVFKLDGETYIDGSLKCVDFTRVPLHLNIDKITSVTFEISRNSSSTHSINYGNNDNIPFGYILNVIRVLLNDRKIILPLCEDVMQLKIEVNGFDDFGCSLVYGASQEAFHLHQGYVTCERYLETIETAKQHSESVRG